MAFDFDAAARDLLDQQLRLFIDLSRTGEPLTLEQLSAVAMLVSTRERLGKTKTPATTEKRPLRDQETATLLSKMPAALTRKEKP